MLERFLFIYPKIEFLTYFVLPGNPHFVTLRNEELFDLCRSPSINGAVKFGKLRWTVSVGRIRGTNEYTILMGKPHRN
jgi:hypothetical protein